MNFLKCKNSKLILNITKKKKVYSQNAKVTS
jgi:hypothetical protein